MRIASTQLPPGPKNCARGQAPRELMKRFRVVMPTLTYKKNVLILHAITWFIMFCTLYTSDCTSMISVHACIADVMNIHVAAYMYMNMHISHIASYRNILYILQQVSEAQNKRENCCCSSRGFHRWENLYPSINSFSIQTSQFSRPGTPINSPLDIVLTTVVQCCACVSKTKTSWVAIM